MLLEIRPKCRHSTESALPINSSNATGGRRGWKATRVERLRAHAETQELLARRRGLVATQELELRQRLLAEHERVVLRQLVQQIKQVNGEAKRADGASGRPALKRDPFWFLAQLEGRLQKQ